MANIDQLMNTALAAIPETGEIEVPTLVQNLKTSGNGDAVPFLRELKVRGVIKAKLVALDGGGVRHTYERVGAE